ncbi:MAG TPA: hypothetical protein VEQ10_03295 [Vicinamibacteria bacterium]|nr:hypothetical protein [Vicinamibacteria bacterium]
MVAWLVSSFRWLRPLAAQLGVALSPTLLLASSLGVATATLMLLGQLLPLPARAIPPSRGR